MFGTLFSRCLAFGKASIMPGERLQSVRRVVGILSSQQLLSDFRINTNNLLADLRQSVVTTRKNFKEFFKFLLLYFIYENAVHFRLAYTSYISHFLLKLQP